MPSCNSALRRCAVYTRKSSEEGLEQDFNSLHAQREACEAFVKSQAGEGWRLIKSHYDDGGFSGGTMERSALQRLLADIKNRLVDVVVVYKVDRLTRSLADFAKMVEIFDAHGVSFVAVTQQFNTTTSMGRLTLNVLLSFAQFEREVTGERIRDKIAASKQKGMWMGGTTHEAFIKSQASEGWKLIKTAYDDGGLSGGTMERPALKRLLADIGAGLIDVVVVYKVDRLTRSLADFAKMVELFDARGVSFVAVTQQFNTTTSMGRLTLNVLLSFAQFEREVTGERIRDKIAASKRKGMWMGGVPPLGYNARERRLVINPAEAETVRHIYGRYLELGCVRQLSKELEQKGIKSKVRVSRNGIRSGGCRYSRGALYELLANPIYIGEIRHKQERHPGMHDAILTRELWERVQQRLNHNAARGRGSSNSSISSPLAGKLFDADGQPLYVQGATKGRRRYRYYVLRPPSLKRSARDVNLPI